MAMHGPENEALKGVRSPIKCLVEHIPRGNKAFVYRSSFGQRQTETASNQNKKSQILRSISLEAETCFRPEYA